MQVDPQRFENQKALEQKAPRRAAADEVSRGMANGGMTNEGCPNEPASSVPHATGYSGADDPAEQQELYFWCDSNRSAEEDYRSPESL